MKEVSFDFEGLSVYQKALVFTSYLLCWFSIHLFSAPASIKHSN